MKTLFLPICVTMILCGCSSMEVDVTKGVKFDRQFNEKLHMEADCDRNDCKSQFTYTIDQKMQIGKIW